MHIQGYGIGPTGIQVGVVPLRTMRALPREVVILKHTELALRGFMGRPSNIRPLVQKPTFLTTSLNPTL